ncbi:MAG: dCTP deaminase [Candidatus Verstraetearchaeota archaeon]|nr:dCTP deaminase [Candidatus Verstraetearchaeota archaeon]
MLSDLGILEQIEQGKLKLDPFSKDCLSASGYDLRSDVEIVLPKGAHALVHTLERVELPPYIAGQLFLRSSFAREGLIGSLALVDPGFRGQLTVSLVNMGSGNVAIDKGERLLQIVFHKLDRPSSRPYVGKYQDSVGTVESKRFFQINM